MHRLRPRVYKKWLSEHAHCPYARPNQNRRDENGPVNARLERNERNLIGDRNQNAAANFREVHQDEDIPMNFGIPADNAPDPEPEEDYPPQNDPVEELEEQDNHCNCPNCQENVINEEAVIFEKTESYSEKLDLNSKLHPVLDITKFEVFVMILTLAMRHGFTGQLVTDLLAFVNKIIGTKCLPVSYHIFQKLFSVDSALTYHFVCEHCNLYLGKYGEFDERLIQCPNCAKDCNVNPHAFDGSFFVTLPLKRQMEDLVKRAGHHIMLRPTPSPNISDICDGKLYKSLCAEGKPLQNRHSLTLTISTDGGQVFENSCKNSLWPIQVVCNELKPGERFRPENMLLAGLWFGKNAPCMSAFLKPLSDELKEMETSGVKRTLSDGQEITAPCFVILCVCDSVAKPKIQNISQFNAYYGCGYCVQRGTYIEECSQVRFPYDGTEYDLRTQQSVMEAMTIADATQRTEMGVKGLSPLLHFPSVHLVFGIPIDYMHAILLGVVKRLVGLWFDETSHGKRYYIRRHEEEVDRRLSGITAPSLLVTRPKAVSKRCVWKAKDWLAFLLFFGLVCLKGLLSEVYLKNFQDLSTGIFILLKDSITEEDLESAQNRLSRFLLNYNSLYGTKNMVYNIHLVSHLVDVKMTGPLHMYSAFSFEGGMGLLIRMVKGTNSVASQICRKYMAAKSLPHILSFHDITDPVQEFCESIVTFKRNKHSVHVDNITLLGGEKLYFLSAAERQMLHRSGFEVNECVRTFNRAIYKGQVITSRNYSRPHKTNDTCVQLLSGEFGIIDLIVHITEPLEQIVMFFRSLRLCPGFEVTEHIHTCAGDPYAETCVLPFTDIKLKGIYFSVEGCSYITFHPNSVERC